MLYAVICYTIAWEYWPDTLEYIAWTNELQDRVFYEYTKIKRYILNENILE